MTKTFRTTVPALLVAGLFLAGTALPVAADVTAAQSDAEPRMSRAPHKTGNRFHHRNVTSETAEFARLELADEAAGRSGPRRSPHKAANRFQHVD